jgi:iron complex transport system substrate-binding protein
MIARNALPRRALPLLLAPLLARAQPMPRTIVAGGGLTEIVYALGGQEALVGVDVTSQFPAAARRLPQVGYLRALGAEGLLSLHPDLIVLGHDAGPPSVVAQLRAVGRRVELMPPIHGPEALAAAVLTLGRLLHRPGAPAVAQAVTEDFAALAGIVAPLPRARCLFLLSAGGGAPMASGTGTAADAMLRLAGPAPPTQSWTTPATSRWRRKRRWRRGRMRS